MLPSDFEYEIKRINKDFYLHFNIIKKKYQVCINEPKMRSFYVVIENEKAKITHSDNEKRILKTLSKDELDDRALLLLRRMEYNFNNCSLFEESKKIDEHNKKLEENNSIKTRKEIQKATVDAYKDMNKISIPVGENNVF